MGRLKKSPAMLFEKSSVSAASPPDSSAVGAKRSIHGWVDDVHTFELILNLHRHAMATTPSLLQDQKSTPSSGRILYVHLNTVLPSTASVYDELIYSNFFTARRIVKLRVHLVYQSPRRKWCGMGPVDVVTTTSF
ncbi:hypothetical protein ABKN59_009437 [Abortiporus biennis]